MDDAGGSASIIDQLEITGDDTDLATQLHDLAEAVQSRLRAIRPEAVFVRRADVPPRPSNTEGPRLRLLAEGAVVSAARSVVINTRIGNGRDSGRLCSSTKEQVESDARDLVRARGLALKWTEAAAAALTALRLR